MTPYQERIRRSNEENLELINQYVLPTVVRQPVALIHGEGSWVWDANGKKYLDFFAGLAVDNLGHSHPDITKVIADQASHIMHCSNIFVIQEQAELAKALVELSGLHQAFFCNSGAEAIEACIKFARYHSLKFNNENRFEIISTTNSFHGRTLGALSATMQKKYQSGFGPLVPGFKEVPFNDFKALKEAINQNTCAILLEPVQGEGGVNIALPDYFKKVRELCDEKNIFLILDEVQVGIGRTGKFFAHQHYGIRPDLMALSKALGSGFPIGACLVSKEVAKAVEPGIHASTFGGNPLASRVALETIRIISDKNFLNKVVDVSNYFLKKLNELKEEFPLIKSVSGLGLIVRCELNEEVGATIVKLCLEDGLLINSIQNKILRFVPPLIITSSEVDQAIEILRKVLKKVNTKK